MILIMIIPTISALDSDLRRHPVDIQVIQWICGGRAATAARVQGPEVGDQKSGNENRPHRSVRRKG